MEKEEQKSRRSLAQFAATAKGLDRGAKLKLILLAAGKKDATYIPLRITPQNLEEKAHLERHMRAAGLRFRASGPKTFETIARLERNAIIWEQTGLWFGYDIFASRAAERMFRAYEWAAKTRKHAVADRIGARLYGYPWCCAVAYHREHDPARIARKYTAYGYFKRVQALERAFPFIVHKPCLPTCSRSRSHNSRNRAVLKEWTPRFFREYTTPRRIETSFVVEGEHDVFNGAIEPYRSVWHRKDGHEYVLLALTPFDRKLWLVSHLTRAHFRRGTRLRGEMTITHNRVNVVVRSVGRTIKGLHHVRHFPLLGKN